MPFQLIQSLNLPELTTEYVGINMPKDIIKLYQDIMISDDEAKANPLQSQYESDWSTLLL